MTVKNNIIGTLTLYHDFNNSVCSVFYLGSEQYYYSDKKETKIYKNIAITHWFYVELDVSDCRLYRQYKR